MALLRGLRFGLALPEQGQTFEVAFAEKRRRIMAKSGRPVLKVLCRRIFVLVQRFRTERVPFFGEK